MEKSNTRAARNKTHAQFGEKKSTRNFKVVVRTRAEKAHSLKT